MPVPSDLARMSPADSGTPLVVGLLRCGQNPTIETQDMKYLFHLTRFFFIKKAQILRFESMKKEKGKKSASESKYLL